MCILWGDGMKQKTILYFVWLGICLCVRSADGGTPQIPDHLNRLRLASLRASEESLTKKPHSAQTAAGPRLIEDYFGKEEVQSPRISSTDALTQSQTSSLSTQPIPITARVSRQLPSDTSPLAIEVLKRSVHAKSAGDAGMVFQPQHESDTMGRSAPSGIMSVPIDRGGVVSALVHAAIVSTEVTTHGLGESVDDDAMYHSARADDVSAESMKPDSHDDVLSKASAQDTDPFWPDGEVPEKTWTAPDGTRCAFFRYKDPTYGQLLADCFGSETLKQKSKPRKLKQD